MFFEEEPELVNDSFSLNQKLYEDVYQYLADNSLVLEESDALLWVEADQKDDELLSEVLEVLPGECQFGFSCQTYPDQTFDINLARGNVNFNIDYDAADAYDDQFGYLFASLKGAQNIVPEFSFRWWVGLEKMGELEDGVRPLVVLSKQQWDNLTQTFGPDRLAAEFEPL